MTNKMVVLKFGGSSVAEPRHWQSIAERLHYHIDNQYCPLLVLSALKNVSNQLEELLHQAIDGKHNEAINHLKKQHLNFSQQLDLDLEQQLQPWFNQLDADCISIYQKQHVSPAAHARVLAVGELLSTTIGAEYLDQRGFNLSWQDSRKLLKSTAQRDQWHHYTSAECEYNYDAQMVERLYGNNQQNNKVVVTQGFIASDSRGNTVLLGREGSDTSAAYLAAMIGAKKLEIWTDVTGVFTANPRDIESARQLPYLSYRQSYLMAKYGAKVLHSRVLKPVEQNGVIVNVRSTGQAAHSGTIISSKSAEQSPVIAVVTEPKAIRLVFKGQKISEQCQQIINQLNSFGFDILFDGHRNDEYYVIVKYVNSDKALFAQMDLKVSFPNENLDIYYDGALVTLVGRANYEDWNNLLEERLKHQDCERVVDYFLNDCGSTYTLFVASSDYLSISQLLHHEFVEKLIKI